MGVALVRLVLTGTIVLVRTPLSVCFDRALCTSCPLPVSSLLIQSGPCGAQTRQKSPGGAQRRYVACAERPAEAAGGTLQNEMRRHARGDGSARTPNDLGGIFCPVTIRFVTRPAPPPPPLRSLALTHLMRRFFVLAGCARPRGSRDRELTA